MEKESKLSMLLTPIAIIVGSFVIAGGIIWSNIHSSQQITAPTQNQPQMAKNQPDTSKVDVKNSPFIGSVNAPVTIVYWYDYQCPFCHQNEEEVMPSLLKDYVSTGKVRVIFKDFPFLGPDSITLALLSHAVWEVAPDQYYAWHKIIFDNQGKEGSGWATKAEILTLSTRALGADIAAKAIVLADTNAKKYQDQILADQKEAADFGVGSTPSFIIGKHLEIGAIGYDALKADIDASLAGK